LRAREGRETNALNCKPNTNLKEKYDLSNYCKTSGFILHAVILEKSFGLPFQFGLSPIVQPVSGFRLI
jgi:hypothetical protein